MEHLSGSPLSAGTLSVSVRSLTVSITPISWTCLTCSTLNLDSAPLHLSKGTLSCPLGKQMDSSGLLVNVYQLSIKRITSVVFANFCGANTPSVAEFKPPIWLNLELGRNEHNCELVGADSSHTRGCWLPHHSGRYEVRSSVRGTRDLPPRSGGESRKGRCGVR